MFWYTPRMAKITKDCLNCGQPYKTNFFSERSKYCSRPCQTAYTKQANKVRLSAIRKERTRIRNLQKNATLRKRTITKITTKNKRTEFVKQEGGVHQFGEHMLTLKNYKEPLKRIPKEEGIGWFGTLAADVETGKVQCHICGQLFDVLSAHIPFAHKMKAREYREKFGLAYTTALISEGQRLRLKESTMKWLKQMTPEEMKAHVQHVKDNHYSYGKTRRTTFQPKKTMEGMNKDGSCPDQTLQAIIDAKNELGYVPSKKEFIELRGSQRYVHLAYKHFGSWTKALEMCHLGEDDFRERLKGGSTNGKPRTYTDEDLLEYLRIYAQEYQQVPTQSDWKRDLLPDHQTYIAHFGTIEAARQLAGVYNIVELSESMKKRSKHYRHSSQGGQGARLKSEKSQFDSEG